MSLSTEQVKSLANIIGARDLDALAAELEEILSIYRYRHHGGRDTFPSPAEAHRTSMEIEKRLAWIMGALIGEGKNPFLAIWLSGALTGNDKGPLFEFPEAVMGLLRTVRQVNADFERNLEQPFEIDGAPQLRKTRTDARDRALIPMLILCGQIHGQVGDDTEYEVIDTICEFLSATMSAVGIPSPDAGDTFHGEAAQGRLRRMVKEELKNPTVFGKITLDK